MEVFDQDAAVMVERRDLAQWLATWLRDAVPLKRWFSDEASYDDQDQSDLQPPRSVMLLVEVDFDENHEVRDAFRMLIASQRDTPFWPHACNGGPDACAMCSNIGGSANVGRGGALLPFAAGGVGPRALNVTSQPFAIARRADDGEITVEILAPPINGWMDLPTAPCVGRPVPASAVPLLGGDRAVLGDALIEAGDPRGELIAHAMRGLDCEALIAAHGRSWLGSLDRSVPRSGIRWRDGVPDEIIAYQRDSTHLDDDILPWRLRPRMRVVQGAGECWVPEMRHVRALGVVSDETLVQIREPTEIEQLAIFGGSTVPRALFPKLRELVIHTDQLPFELPADVEIELAWRGDDSDKHAAWLAAWSASGAKVVCSMHEPTLNGAVGWTFDLRDEVVAISHRGFHPFADLQRLAALRGALGNRPSRDVASNTWSP